MLHHTSHVDGSNWSTPYSIHHSGAVQFVRCEKKNHIGIIKQPTQKFQKTQILTNKHVQNISLIPTQNFQTNLQSF